MTFKSGDRVEYVGKSNIYADVNKIGLKGTVVKVGKNGFEDGVVVELDEYYAGNGKEHTFYPENIEAIEDEDVPDDTYNFYISIAETCEQVALYARDAADNYLAFKETSDKLNELINGAIERLNK